MLGVIRLLDLFATIFVFFCGIVTGILAILAVIDVIKSDVPDDY